MLHLRENYCLDIINLLHKLHKYLLHKFKKATDIKIKTLWEKTL